MDDGGDERAVSSLGRFMDCGVVDSRVENDSRHECEEMVEEAGW